jgi:hypothetical protein
MKTYRAVLKHAYSKTRITTTASSEEAARQNICNAEGCPGSSIIDIKENGPAWSELTEEQNKVCALYAYYLFCAFQRRGIESKKDFFLTKAAAAQHACELFNVPFETIIQIKDGYIEGLRNLNKISAKYVYGSNYDFSTL